MTSRPSVVIQEFFKSIPFDTIGEYYQKAVDVGLVDVALHPFDYADTLIRLGYEPFPPVEESNLFHGKSLVLPGITSYVYYLYSIDGASGVFRGVVPYVAGNLIYRHLSAYIMHHSPFPLDHPENVPRLTMQFTDANVGHFVKTRFWRLLSNVVALHAAYPLHVIAVRTMARFVTAAATEEKFRPEIAESWIDELKHVKGFDELFAGCQARILREITFALIAGGSVLALLKVAQLLKTEPEQADSLERSIEYIGNSIAGVYINPFRNVSDIMIINKTNIPLGNPPFNEQYSTCWECYKKLRKDRMWKNSTSRGLFHPGRKYSGPTETHNGKLMPRHSHFGPVYWPRHSRGMDDLPYFLKGHYEAWNNAGGILGAARVGVHEGIGAIGRQTRSGSVVMSGIKGDVMMSERAPVEFLGLNSNSFNFYGSGGSSNPFGL